MRTYVGGVEFSCADRSVADPGSGVASYVGEGPLKRGVPIGAGLALEWPPEELEPMTTIILGKVTPVFWDGSGGTHHNEVPKLLLCNGTARWQRAQSLCLEA